MSDILCIICEKGDCENKLILCDGCDRGFHTYCLNLPAVPAGDWHCNKCTDKLDDKFILKPRSIVHLYERVSTKGQDNPMHGNVGLDTQNNTLLKYALDNNLIIKSTLRESASAYNVSEVSIMPCLKRFKKGECLLVYSVSRFSRNVVKGGEMLKLLDKIGAYVYSVSENVYSYEDKFYLLLKNAELESKNLSKKIRSSHQRIKMLGGHIGRAPYGYDSVRDTSGVRKLKKNNVEQKIINLIKKDKPSLELISKVSKIAMNRGKPWTFTALRRIYRSNKSNMENFVNDMRDEIDKV